MRIKELLELIDIDRIEHDDLKYMLRHMRDVPDEPSPEEREAFLNAMYGDEAEDLELEQKRLDLVKTQAEVEKLRAVAQKDRAAARRPQ